MVTLCVCGVALLACTDEPAPRPPDPTAAPSDEPPVEPTPEPTSEPEEGPEAEVHEELAGISEEVSAVRGLEILEQVDVEVVTADELADVVADADREAEAIERLASAARVLTALRHLEPDVDLGTMVEDLQTAAVVGLYDPRQDRAYVSGDALPLTPGAAATAAHELVHALQDQHFDLARLDDIPDEDGDAALAFLSLVEGDAVLAEEEWAAVHQGEEERAAAEQEQIVGAQAQLDVLEDTPSYVVESFVFPYVAGERFVAALIEHGGYEAVDAALEDPPTTTLEILEPQAYLDGFEAQEPPPAGPPAADAEEVFRSTFGAFDLLALFGATDRPAAQAGSAAWTGWRGGEIAAWETTAGLVVSVGWSFEDAELGDTVCEALPEWYRDAADGVGEQDDVLESDRDVFVRRCDATEVSFALGPDADLASAALSR